jgi:hypothetical protein
MALTLETILEDLHAVEGELRELEKKYKVRSDIFYELYRSGNIEHRNEFIRWVALIEAKQRREKEYEEIAHENPDQLTVALSK